MSNSNLIVFGVIGVIAVGLIYMITQNNKRNDLPTLSEFARQQPIDLGISQGSVGAVGLPEGKAYNPNEIAGNIMTSNLINEDALRNLINRDLAKTEIQTVTSAGTEVRTKAIRDVDISTPKSLSLFRSDDSFLTVHDSFRPLGDASVIGVRNKLVSPLSNVKARKEKTFSATISTKTGGTRNILVTESALKRLQSNLISAKEV